MSAFCPEGCPGPVDACVVGHPCALHPAHTTERKQSDHLTQTILATPENKAQGIYGNCMQAAVAIALGKPLDYVPHFGAFATWPAALRLRGEGLDYTHVPALHAEPLPIPTGRVMLVGDSPRGTKHAVAAIDGQILDPHPSRSGLTKILGAYIIHEWDHDNGPSACFACGRKAGE